MTISDAASAATDGPELVINRHFKATRKRVFAAFTEAERLAQWFGPEGTTCLDAEVDASVGGRYRLPVVGEDSGELHTVVGEYLEIVPGEKLVFTWAWLLDDGARGKEMVVTLTFADAGNGTDLTLHQTGFEDADVRDKHNWGWDSSFDCLERVLA